MLAFLALALLLTAFGATGQAGDAAAATPAPQQADADNPTAPSARLQAPENPAALDASANDDLAPDASKQNTSSLDAPATDLSEQGTLATDASSSDSSAQGPGTASNPQSPGGDANQTGPQGESNTVPLLKPQPKRILGIMPNFRAVSAGVIPPPPTAGEAFKIATRNSFDYSSFLFTGLTSVLAEVTNTHPVFGKGVEGFGDYYWRGFADSVDGNYWVVFVMPTIFHQDERYYAMGTGGFWRRLKYSASRVAITPNKEGNNSFNASEILGRGIAQGISTAYYPDQVRTFDALAAKYGFAVLRDALTNSFREFWPDISARVLHRHS